MEEQRAEMSSSSYTGYGNYLEPEPQDIDISEMPEMTAEEQLAMLQLSEKIMRKQERILSEQLYKLKIEEVSLRRAISNQNRKNYNSFQQQTQQSFTRETPSYSGRAVKGIYMERDYVGEEEEEDEEELGSHPPPPPIKASEMQPQTSLGSTEPGRNLLNEPDMLGPQPPPPPITLTQLPLPTPLHSSRVSHDFAMGSLNSQPSQSSRTNSQTMYDSLYF